jgi:hypothetical protein
MQFIDRSLETLIGDLPYRRFTLFMGARMGNFGMKISRATASSLRAASNERHNCFPNVSGRRREKLRIQNRGLTTRGVHTGLVRVMAEPGCSASMLSGRLISERNYE